MSPERQELGPARIQSSVTDRRPVKSPAWETPEPPWASKHRQGNVLGIEARVVNNTHEKMIEIKGKERAKAGERTQAAKVPIHDVTAIRISDFCCGCYRMSRRR